MPRLSLSIFEPIVIEIKGLGEFKIETLSSKLLGELQKAVASIGAEPEKVQTDGLVAVLMKMLPGITKEQAEEIDFRHIVRIANFLAEQIGEANEAAAAKN
jgi:hypothetical protein